MHQNRRSDTFQGEPEGLAATWVPSDNYRNAGSTAKCSGKFKPLQPIDRELELGRVLEGRQAAIQSISLDTLSPGRATSLGEAPK